MLRVQAIASFRHLSVTPRARAQGGQSEKDQRPLRHVTRRRAGKGRREWAWDDCSGLPIILAGRLEDSL